MTDALIGDSAWLMFALQELGVREYTVQHPGPHGELSNPRIEEYQHVAGQKHTDDEIPWCASYISWCLARAKYPHLGTGARAYQHYGTELVRPIRGCIAPMWRGDPNGTKGHVNFFWEMGPCTVTLCDTQGQKYTATAKGGEFVGLGGNQGNIVTVHQYDIDRVLSWRHP